MPSSRLLAYFVVISLALLTAARSHPQRRNVGTSTTNRRSQRSDSTEYGGPLKFDGTLLSAMNTSDWNSNKMVKRDSDHHFKTLVLSPRENFINTWTGPISIFDKTEQVVFSTGVSNTWIRESAIDLDGRPPISSFKEAGYEGEVHEAPVTIAGIEVEMAIAHMSKYQFQYETNRLGSGVVGLGLGPGTFFHEPSFYEHAIKQKRVKEPVFAFDFGKAQPELHFGRLDKSRVIEEKDWHVLVPFGEARSWVISKGEINIGNEKGVVQGMKTLIDTSAQGIYGPKAAVKTIFDHIPGSVEYMPHWYAVPCNNLSTISLRWGAGNPWEFKHNSFILRELEEGHEAYAGKRKDAKPMCLTVLRVIKQSREEESEYDWKIGVPFLKNVYAAFDMGEHQISCPSNRHCHMSHVMTCSTVQCRPTRIGFGE